MLKIKKAKLHLGRKLNEWIDSLPKELRKPVRESCFVTGGSLVSLLTGEPVNDYDVYLDDKETLLKLAEHYVSKLCTGKNWKCSQVKVELTDTGVRCYIKSAGMLHGNEDDYQYFEQGGDVFEFIKSGKRIEEPYAAFLITDNAISLTSDVQIIMRFSGDPQEVHKNFDFAHCTCWYKLASNELVVPHDAALSIMTKELVYSGSLYPICSLIRTRKFIKRGWSIHAGEYLKMAFQVSELDLTDHEVLRDQLCGVDAAYFGELLSALKKDGKELTSTYLAELVNEAFS